MPRPSRCRASSIGFNGSMMASCLPGPVHPSITFFLCGIRLFSIILHTCLAGAWCNTGRLIFRREVKSRSEGRCSPILCSPDRIICSSRAMQVSFRLCTWIGPIIVFKLLLNSSLINPPATTLRIVLFCTNMIGSLEFLIQIYPYRPFSE